MDTSILEDLGLSKGEITVYLTLLKLGTTKVGGVIEKSNMASSAVHNSLNSLLEKGLVSYIKKGKIKHYQAAPPKYIGHFTEQKLEKFYELLPQIQSNVKSSEDKQEAEVFEGIQGVTAMLNLLIEDTKKGDEYIFFAAYFIGKNKEIQEFFEKYDFRRKQKGLYLRGLAPLELKPLFIGRRNLLHMKYPACPIPFDISVCNNKVALVAWGEKPVGYLLKSKQMAEMYKEYFEKIWKIS
jgi:predicted transcriptional regulator